MAQDPIVHLHLDVARYRGTLTGQVGVEGAAARPFTGWIGLNAAIDTLLADVVGEDLPDHDPIRRS